MLLGRLQLFRNIGQFDSVSSAATIALAPLTAIFAENGRGKTTLAAILRSLGSGDPLPINERRRLSATHPPHVIIEVGAPPLAIFNNGAWSRNVSEIAVFDDEFVSQNVYSGLGVDPAHRQNLHELILGAQGVNLNNALEAAVAGVEQANRDLRAAEQAIPAASRGALTVDAFCALAPRDDIDAAIAETSRSLEAARNQAAIRQQPPLQELNLPEFDGDGLRDLSNKTLADIEAKAMQSVAAHFARIGDGGENWVAQGVPRIYAKNGQEECPFCAQPLDGSPLIAHYRSYFSAEYAALKQEIAAASRAHANAHGIEAQVGFERAVNTMMDRLRFWAPYIDIADFRVDVTETLEAWKRVRAIGESGLAAKSGVPLEALVLPDLSEASAEYDLRRSAIAKLNEQLRAANAQIAVVKEQAAAADANAITNNLTRLQATKARNSVPIVPLCAAYVAAKTAKAVAETARDAARQALDHYRATIFPAYQTAINLYLQRFNAGFRLDRVESANTRGGSSCTYNVVVDSRAIAVGGAVPAGTPSFKTVLSAGDRNTLALAFFFASLDQDPNKTSKIVVIDDPITSLDEHRALVTVQEMRRLVDQVAQVIVLSHNRPFLCNIWEGMDKNRRAALEVVRDTVGSTIRGWNVNRDCITENDKRHEIIRAYVAQATPNGREVAQALRPTLEAFLRVAYPETFPPGQLLGPFRGICEQRVGTTDQILSQTDIDELRDLTEYANRFHHDTNPAWQTAIVNDTELVGFAQRALRFARRS